MFNVFVKESSVIKSLCSGLQVFTHSEEQYRYQFSIFEGENEGTIAADKPKRSQLKKFKIRHLNISSTI